MSTATKLPDADVTAMLAALSAHFGEPVLPASRYCAAFDAWATAIERAATKPACGGCDTCGSINPFPWAEHIGAIRIAIGKSSMLARLIYGGETLRTVPCPEHKGHWSGITWEQPACGCDLTGWLPATHDTAGAA